MTQRIGILLFDGAEELDAVGPWEVLAFWTREFPEDGWEVLTYSADGAGVTCAKGLRLLVDHAEATRPPLDVLLVPGGEGTRALLTQPDVLERVRTAAPLTTSVCTGALVLAAAGMLRDRPATTYWSCFDELVALDPTIEPRPDDRWVDDGDVITAAGVSAGIDMALHLVRRLAGEERALQVRKGIQYDPAPPV